MLPLCENQVHTIKKYAYYLSSGMLGGITFGMKYFYRAVARGFWHIDGNLGDICRLLLQWRLLL